MCEIGEFGDGNGEGEVLRTDSGSLVGRKNVSTMFRRQVENVSFQAQCRAEGTEDHDVPP